MIPIEPPIVGRWALGADFPSKVTLAGEEFSRTWFAWPYRDVVAQYRQSVPRNSMHALVYKNGDVIIDHFDEANPDFGLVWEHLTLDVDDRR